MRCSQFTFVCVHVYKHGYMNVCTWSKSAIIKHKSTCEFMERNKKCRYVSSSILNAQTLDKYQHVAKRLLVLILWRLNSTLFGDNTVRNNKSHCPIIDWMTLIRVSATPPSAQSSYCGIKWLRNGKVLGHLINAKISPKVASEKVQTMVSESRCIYLSMGFFRQSFMILFCINTSRSKQQQLSHPPK